MISLNNMRYGFSMITAIFVILLLSSVGAFIVNLSGKTVKSTTLQYKKEQSALLAKSYTELAIMGVTANDATSGSNCLEEIIGTVGGDPANGEGYEVEVNISYIGDNTELKCSSSNILSTTDDILRDQQLYIIVDVFIRYIDFDIVSMATVTDDTPRIIYHRRTIQRI